MDAESRASKISSARKLLKNYQQKKADLTKGCTEAPKAEFTYLTDPSVLGSQENIDTSVERPYKPMDDQHLSQSSYNDAQRAAALPMFTFPSDGDASFSEYLGGGSMAAPPDPPARSTSSTSSSTPVPESSPAAATPPAASVSDLSLPPAETSTPAAPPPEPPAAAAAPAPAPPAPAAAGERPPSRPSSGEAAAPAADESPPGASMASSFTFASQAGTGSRSSAASSRHSDWEYVHPEPAKQQEGDAPAPLTSETLRQLSDRLSQMTSDEELAADLTSAPAASRALEERNAELAAALDAERRLRLEAQQHLDNLRARVSELESESESARLSADQRAAQQQQQQAEQARAQAQTIGILVAEKTELKSDLERLQAELAAKTAECTQLSGRLSAAEASVRQLQEQMSRADQTEVSVQHLQSLYAQADNERNRNRELCSALQEELEEARQRLRAQLNANQQLQRQLAESGSRLELAEIRLTQLGGAAAAAAGPAGPAAAELQEARRQAEAARAERDAAAVQFREYSAALAGRLAQAERERDELAARLAEREAELAAATEAAAAAAAAASRVPARSDGEGVEEREQAVTDAEREELLRLRRDAETAAEEAATLRRELRALSEENTRLTLAGQQQQTALHDMEITVERVNAAAVDSSQLAREMESDRVAASRAMAQNKQLKQQLQELQDGFIALSNKKLELTESMELERQTAAERQQQVTLLEEELTKVTARATEAEKQNMTAQQVIDQLRHFEAVGRQAEALQADLAAAEEKLARLQSDPPPAPERPVSPASEDRAASPQERAASPQERAASPSLRPRPPVEDVIREREELRARLQQFIGGGAVDPAEHEKLRSAMAQLEVRFRDVMAQLAEMREERQALEHLCEQLRGETDTIGEYISLYQVQRSALKQQALERQQELNTLNADREQLRQQLQQLQRLVRQLLGGRQPAEQLLPAELGVPAEPGGQTDQAPPAEEPAPPERAPETPESGENGPVREQTARRIISLIEQIGASEYVDGHAPPLHVCQHCRGKRVLNV